MSDKNPKAAKVRKELKVPTGLPPEARLLPPEVGQQKAAARARGRAIVVAIIALGLVVLASAGSSLYSFQRLLALDSARAQTQTLTIQQGEFNDVRSADQMVKSATAARLFAMSTEISLKDLMIALRSQLPGGAGIVSYGFETATPLQSYGESTSLLDPDRMAQMSMDVSFPSLSALDKWVQGVREINGVVGSTLAFTELQEDGSYSASVLVLIGESALLHRFEIVEGEPVAAEDPEAEPAPTPTPTESPIVDGDTTEEESGE